MLDTDLVCVRRLISHLEIDALAIPMADMVLQQMNWIIEALRPITDFSTRVRKVTINGESYTLIEVTA
jgi:hypothetical protein